MRAKRNEPEITFITEITEIVFNQTEIVRFMLFDMWELYRDVLSTLL